MRCLVAAGLLMATAVLTSPGASANPDITDPYCTGGQTPLYGQCKMQPTDPDLDTTGLDPEVGMGINPEMFPAV
ncbi:MAG: hypothetical protein WEB51_05675 [Mycobacterium sp.]